MGQLGDVLESRWLYLRFLSEPASFGNAGGQSKRVRMTLMDLPADLSQLKITHLIADYMFSVLAMS